MSPKPFESSRATISSSGSMPVRRSSMSAHGSSRRATRSGTLAIVNTAGSTSASSDQVTGIDTRPSGLRRTEYGAHIERSRAFWLKSMKIRLPRSSFHHDVVTVSGSRRSSSRASAMTARRPAMKSHRGSMGTYT